MKASEVVTVLAVNLPQLTDLLTTNIPVDSLSRSGTVVTANCDAAHGLEPGDRVAIVGAVEVIPISSLTRSGTTGTLVTSTDHDLTNPVAETITISGAAEPEFNGEFVRLNIENRQTITFEMDDSGATTATGSPVLEDAERIGRRYDGTYEVLETPSDVNFTFTQNADTLPDPIGDSIVARAKTRVSSTTDPDRAIASYTKQEIDALWAFVVLADVTASKSRDIRSDAIDNLQRGDEYRQQIIQPFSVYTIATVGGQIGGSAARDQAEELFRSVTQVLVGYKFDSGLFVGNSQGPAQFVSHATFAYNTATYVHVYNFEQVVDLVFEDTVGASPDVAFRDISMTLTPVLPEDQGLGNMTATIDLDDELL